MKNTWVLFFCAAAAFSLTAQTPAPAPADAKPIRHLEYDFAVSYMNNGETHGSGFSGGGSGGVGSGVGSLMQHGGWHGSIAVDVLSVNPDGSLHVAISQLVYAAPRRSRTFTCNVYGDGSMNCPEEDAESVTIPDSEGILLGYLGRGFVDPSAASGGTWEHSYHAKEFDVVTDYTLTPAATGPATIVKKSKTTPRIPEIAATQENATINYDQSLSVPVKVHDVLDESRHSATSETVADYTLTADSFAKPKP